MAFVVFLFLIPIIVWCYSVWMDIGLVLDGVLLQVSNKICPFNIKTKGGLCASEFYHYRYD